MPEIDDIRTDLKSERIQLKSERIQKKIQILEGWDLEEGPAPESGDSGEEGVAGGVAGSDGQADP